MIAFLLIIALFITASILNFVLDLPYQIYTGAAAVAALGILFLKYLLRKQPLQEKADQEKTTYHSALFQSNLDANIVYNKETLEVIDCNRQVSHMFELPDDTSLKGMYISQVMMRYLADDSPNMDLLMNNIPGDWQGEAGFITHNKTKFYSYLRSVICSEGNTEYQVLSIRDITGLKKAEQKLNTYKESVEKAAKSKARFLSSMSHELRTPLNGIIGSSNLVLAEPNLPESIKNHINVLRYSSEHMLGIINDILDFSKIDAGKLELKQQPFNVKECMDNITGSFALQYKNKNIELLTDYEPGLENIQIMSDEVKLSQVIANLLSNALKFTLMGSVELKVSIKSVTPEEVNLSFEVKDTGIGIAKEKQAEIFQGFAQVHADELRRRFGGTGLGLTISERLVTMFGGKLEVESELGKGARFYFTISCEPAPSFAEETDTPVVAEPVNDIRGVRILVVEDNEINADILRGFLRRWQIQVKEAITGVHALELLKYHKFDLVLMDLEMPEMDGYTTIKRIRETNTEMPVIAFTAALLENMDALITEAGFTDYVLKPFRPSELKKKIELHAKRKIEYV